jgi:hypothetical protein
MLFGADGTQSAIPPHSVVCVWKNVVSYDHDTRESNRLETLDTVTQLGIGELVEVPTSDVEELLSVARTLGIEEEVSQRWQAEGRLEIGGEAKWGPPTPFARALSVLYPNVGIRVSGTTEHEAYDDYLFFNGESYPLTIFVENLQTGAKWWDVRDGVVYNPPEYEYDPDDEYEAPPEYAGI